MIDKFGFKYVISSLKIHSASDNGWSACAFDGNEFYPSRKYEIRIDRVGEETPSLPCYLWIIKGKNFKMH